jgi:hypothetical protein
MWGLDPVQFEVEDYRSWRRTTRPSARPRRFSSAPLTFTGNDAELTTPPGLLGRELGLDLGEAGVGQR